MTGGLLVLMAVLGAADGTLEKTAQLGPVTATVKLKPAEPLIGDTVMLTISVLAEKDVEVLMPEFGEALDRFTILDYVPRRELADDERTRAIQTYQLQPPVSGPQSIPPILIEFVDRRVGQRAAPEGLDAYELLTPRIDFEVQSVVPKDAASELKPPLGELLPLGTSPVRRLWWVVGGLLMLGAVAPFAVRYWRRYRQLARRRSAYEIARARLNRLLARPLPRGAEVDAFFVDLSGIVRRYLEDRFSMRAPELTTEEFFDAVSDSPDLLRAHQSLLLRFLRQADLVKFAGVQPSEPDIREALAAAERFLEETRDAAPLIDEPQMRMRSESRVAAEAADV